jgi:type IV pilus assembly protein PilC
MPTFSYTARDQNGKSTNGVLAANDINQLREQLRQRELYLTSVREQASVSESRGGGLLGRRSVKLGDLVVMSRQFSTLVGAGLPIVEALFALTSQTENPVLVATLNEVRMDVLTGSTLTEALARHPKVFNELYISLVHAGEAGGVLEHTLETAAVQFEKEAELREKVRSAFVYPILVLITAAGVVSFLLTFVVPVFDRVYKQFHANLPVVTQSLIWTSHVVVYWWWVVLLGIVGTVYLIRQYVKTPRGRAHYDRLKLSLPLFGKLNRKIAIARFTRTMSAMVSAGVPILQALVVSARTSGNVIIVEAVTKVAQFVKEGARIWIPLEQTGEFPSMVTRMIAAGEESGNLDEMFAKMTQFYDRDIEYAVNRLTRLLEPAMTVFIGGIVLFVLLALYMPIFGLTRVIRK